MNLMTITFGGREFSIDADAPFSIAVPLQFNGTQPNAYGVERASSEPCEAGALVGDTRRGGSCNFEEYRFIPHCNGTHTECVGHITRERISVHDCLQDAFILASLISVAPEKAADSSESYAVDLNENDLLITRTAIEKALENLKSQISNFKFEALIVRHMPNDEGKLSKTYLEEIPPFFSTEAMLFLRESGVRHLLCDLPSIDRIYDEGKLSNHRIFWNIEQGAFEISGESLVHNTITELIYVPNEIADGNYLLNLQIAPFASDASPSRPLLFRILS
jgi:arylformamidase